MNIIRYIIDFFSSGSHDTSGIGEEFVIIDTAPAEITKNTTCTEPKIYSESCSETCSDSESDQNQKIINRNNYTKKTNKRKINKKKIVKKNK